MKGNLLTGRQTTQRMIAHVLLCSNKINVKFLTTKSRKLCFCYLFITSSQLCFALFKITMHVQYSAIAYVIYLLLTTERKKLMLFLEGFKSKRTQLFLNITSTLDQIISSHQSIRPLIQGETIPLMVESHMSYDDISLKTCKDYGFIRCTRYDLARKQHNRRYVIKALNFLGVFLRSLSTAYFIDLESTGIIFFNLCQ